ncbi:hypothetical protein [Amycolatopsis panacis]|uniref:Uncharacterized protein n=1 Tax=Amycolatopsis panacis TaxID=2340917 RepID=A0A419I3K2_9PSEU|nr:hypothetical protein [Amycolatopsis panacis]RJQ84767.1 hypothetical protein D5S19_16000 [Amycolatopsis panacis]
MGTLIEMQRLQLSRPVGVEPADAVVAAWQARHAVVLEHLAEEGSGLAAVSAVAVHRRETELAGRGVA